jgi:hypothetical protein
MGRPARHGYCALVTKGVPTDRSSDESPDRRILQGAVAAFSPLLRTSEKRRRSCSRHFARRGRPAVRLVLNASRLERSVESLPSLLPQCYGHPLAITLHEELTLNVSRGVGRSVNENGDIIARHVDELHRSGRLRLYVTSRANAASLQNESRCRLRLT